MKIQDIYSPIYREIAQYIEDNDIYDYGEIMNVCVHNRNYKWMKVLSSERGCRFFSRWFFYKRKDRERMKEKENKK